MSIVSHRRLRHASAARLRRRLRLPITIVSGGQTGADRAALLWAVSRAAPVGGWCPRGRLAEDGQVPGHFPLRETPSARRAQRTAWNVRDADATVLFTSGHRLHGGCLLTARCAARLGRPFLHLHAAESRTASKELARFLLLHRPRVLNVAGGRASESPHIAAWVAATLDKAITSPASSLGGASGKLCQSCRRPEKRA